MAVRLLSHGYDLYGPTKSVLYHNWKREYRKVFFAIQNENERDKSIQKIKDIMTGKLEDERHGLGVERSWEGIQDYMGINFEKREFTRPHKPWSPPVDWDQQQIKDEFCVN